MSFYSIGPKKELKKLRCLQQVGFLCSFFFVCVCVNARVFVRAFLNKSSLGCYRSHGTSRVRNDDDPEKKHIFFIVSLTMWQVTITWYYNKKHLDSFSSVYFVASDYLPSPRNSKTCIFPWPRPGDSYWVLYCIYNTCKYWVYPILTMGIVIFQIQYNIFFLENSGILTKVRQTGEKWTNTEKETYLKKQR